VIATGTTCLALACSSLARDPSSEPADSGNEAGRDAPASDAGPGHAGDLLDASTDVANAGNPFDAGPLPPEPIVWGFPTDVPVHGDFDADGRPDLAVYRVSFGNAWWAIVQSKNTQRMENRWGFDGDVPVPADFEGDGRTKCAIFRRSEANWYVASGPIESFGKPFKWGTPEDTPTPFDVDGDKKADYGVFSKSTGTYTFRRSTDGTTLAFSLVAPADGASGRRYPVRVDFDGDHIDDPAIYIGGIGVWTYRESSTGATRTMQFGLNDDVPLSADFDGDGRSDTAVYRPSTSEWLAILSRSSTELKVQFGTTGDKPMPGDYDHDGRTDIVVWRPSDSTWRSKSVTLIGPHS
jgi:hypothetical protein